MNLLPNSYKTASWNVVLGQFQLLRTNPPLMIRHRLRGSPQGQTLSVSNQAGLEGSSHPPIVRVLVDAQVDLASLTNSLPG